MKKWIRVGKNYDRIPVGSLISADVNGGPSIGWYREGVSWIQYKEYRDETLYFKGFNDREVFESYIQAFHYDLIYLVEVEPYDPNQEPEDDCL